MTQQHTPGPWDYSLPDLDIFYDDRDRNDVRPLIATVYRDNVSPDQAEADARLIAAAPELLAALRGLLETCLGPGWSDDEYIEKLAAGAYKHPDMVKPYAKRVLAARTAIAKARGEG